MTQIVSIVDANPVNQNALRLFIKSFEKYSTMPLKSLLVLYPKDRLNFNFIHWLKRKNIQTESYSLTSEDGDPYKAKFLLMDYIRSCKDNKDDVLYIDPDHIFLKDFSFKPQDDVLIVSSEVKDGSQFKDTQYFHFNTSIIFGKVNLWKFVIEEWEEIYEKIKRDISYRFREEIAFSVAAKISNVELLPAPSLFQGNFHSFDINCAMFHYGGEYVGSKKVKDALKEELFMEERLRELNKQPNSKEEVWLFQHINNLYTR